MQYNIVIRSQGKMRFMLQAFEGTKLISNTSYKDPILLELGKRVIESQGYKYNKTEKIP